MLIRQKFIPMTSFSVDLSGKGNFEVFLAVISSLYLNQNASTKIRNWNCSTRQNSKSCMIYMQN